MKKKYQDCCFGWDIINNKDRMYVCLSYSKSFLRSHFNFFLSVSGMYAPATSKQKKTCLNTKQRQRSCKCIDVVWCDLVVQQQNWACRFFLYIYMYIFSCLVDFVLFSPSHKVRVCVLRERRIVKHYLLVCSFYYSFGSVREKKRTNSTRYW